MEEAPPKRKRGRPRKADLIPRQNIALPEMHLEPSERKFVAAWIETGQIKRASELTGISERTGARWSKRGDILTALEAAFTKYGIDEASLADRLYAALHATRVTMIPQGDGSMEIAYTEDHPTQLRAAGVITDILFKLRSLERGSEGNTDLPELPTDLSTLGAQEIIEYAVKRTIKRNF